MIKKQLLVVVLTLLISDFCDAQERGIQFTSNLSWNQIKEKANKEDKYIFVDCYATWCGPCKFMSREVFTKQSVGAFFGEHFISIQIQMDTTNSDAIEIRNSRSEAKQFARDFAINAYPTYVIFSPKGEPLHRFVGACKNDSEFLGKINDAFDQTKQYYPLIYHYSDHLKDSAFLRNALSTAIDAQDNSSASKISESYFACITNPLERQNLELLFEATSSDRSNVFQFFLKNQVHVDIVMGQKFTDGFARSVIYKSEIYPLEQLDKQIDWNNLRRRLFKQFPNYAGWTINSAQLDLYRRKNEWIHYANHVKSYFLKYGNRLTPYEVNGIAWALFQHSKDKELLKQALRWSALTIAKYPNIDWEYVDTYANLLYKLGDKSKAIIWEQKAITIAGDEDQRLEFKQNLQKMLGNVKTWQ